MARPLRLQFPGALYHVHTRGNRKKDIFFDYKDKKLFLQILAETVSRHNWICHAYCLMGNHYHLILETPDGNLSTGMRFLNGVYTQKFNYRHKICGHLFQGRFKSKLVDKENYLVTLCAYIILNPVKDGFTDLPENWPWSSYGATIGVASKPDFLTIDSILRLFGENKTSARRQYVNFVHGLMRITPEIEDLTNNPVIGKEDFIQRYRSLLEDRESIKEFSRQERFFGRPMLESIFNWKHRERLSPKRSEAKKPGRKMAGDKMSNEKELRKEKILEAYYKFGYKMSEIARFLNVHYTTVSKIINGVRS